MAQMIALLFDLVCTCTIVRVGGLYAVIILYCKAYICVCSALSVAVSVNIYISNYAHRVGGQVTGHVDLISICQCDKIEVF